MGTHRQRHAPPLDKEKNKKNTWEQPNKKRHTAWEHTKKDTPQHQFLSTIHTKTHRKQKVNTQNTIVNCMETTKKYEK